MKGFLDFLEKVFRNWKTKLFFIFISLIFALVYHTYILSYKIIDIPLFYEINPTLSLLNEVPNTVPLKIKGREEILNQISSKDFKASIDSQNIKEEGFYSLSITIESQLKDTQGLQYSSEISKINLTLEKTKKALIEVVPSFSGSLGDGLEIEEINLFPKRVIIEGPISIVTLLQQIPIKPIDLSIHQESFSQLVEIDTPFNLKTSNKSLISINVNIKTIRESIQFDNIAIEVINLSPSLLIDNFEEEGWFASSFMAKDKDISIESLKDTQLIIDLSQIKGEGSFNLPVQILTKAEKQYLSYGPHEVSLSVKEKQKEEI